MERRADDHEIVKKRYRAFYGTRLDELLETLRVHTLVVAGINTQACIRTTIVGAYQRDFDVIVPSTCVGSYDAEHHAITLRYVDGRMAQVVDTEAIIRLIS